MPLFKRRGTPAIMIHVSTADTQLSVHVRRHRNTGLGPISGSYSGRAYDYPGLADASDETLLACLKDALAWEAELLGNVVPRAALPRPTWRWVPAKSVPPGRGGRGGGTPAHRK